MEKKQKNEWVVVSFFPFSLNKKEKQNVNRWCVSEERLLQCAQPLPSVLPY